MDYQLTIHAPGETAVRRITADPDGLAQAVHHHARGILGSSRVDVHLDPHALTGGAQSNGAAVATFTLAKAPILAGHTTPREVLHGYGLEDLHQIARHVVRADRWHSGADVEDRYDAAWHAIAERLVAADEPPTRGELFRAGIEGSDRAVRQTQQAHGYNTHQPGAGSRPNFERYWFLDSAPTPSPEARIVERRALRQIWPQLTPRQQDALNALAATGDYQQAAAALGVTPGTFHVLISGARKRFFTWWHEHETPSRMWGTDRRVGSRSATAPATSKRRPATRAVVRRTGRPVHELIHGKASTYNNHDCRCTPCTQAATDEAREKGRRNGATARRRITVSQLADIRTRHNAGETLTSIAGVLGFSDTYLSRLLSGTRKPAPDPS